MSVVLLLLATLSIWDYPARHPTHEQLRRQFIVATQKGDVKTMEASCRKGVELLPDDPTWHYNLACALAYAEGKEASAFDELEMAIDLGFRNKAVIAADADLKRLSTHPRYKELLEYAEEMQDRPLVTGPLATIDATGPFGQMITLGEESLGWDFDVGCFVAKMRLSGGAAGRNAGDLYMNRDGGHAMICVTNHPGLTPVRLSKEGRARHLDMSVPNVLFPYPVFGNASLALAQGPFRRSVSRAMMTTESIALGRMVKYYLSNQIWAFPSVNDTAPVGTNGDLFASITPCWMTTAGRSWSDLPYVDAALLASRALQPSVKSNLVSRGLLAPTILTLIRKSLKGVRTEDDYLTAKAHPTALPPGGVERNRLVAQALNLTVETTPPLVSIAVRLKSPELPSARSELTYASSFAWAFVLRADDEIREFLVEARGADEFAFVQTHGTKVEVKIERLKPNVAKVTVDRRGLSPVNRVDLTVVGRNKGTGWGAPSYVSIARMEASSPLSDPVLK